MQILVQNGVILHSVDNDSTIVSFDANQNQVVLITQKYTHNDLMVENQFNNYAMSFNSLVNLFSLPELISLFQSAVSVWYKTVIDKEYPFYKQINIIRQGNGYSSADLQTMATFIDNNRTACKTKIADIAALTDSNDVVKYSIYK